VSMVFACGRAVIVAGCVLIVAGFSGAAPSSAGTRVVRIAKFAFDPAELAVSVGDTIVWENGDILHHAVAADSAQWGSRELPLGARFQIVASDTGRFPYHCSAHPTMHGVLVVK
jgi:plastocyanin